MKTKLLFLASIFALAASAAAYSQPLFDRITMTTTIVSNMQQAKAFYNDDLGFKVTKDYGAAGLTVVGPNVYEAVRFATAAFAVGEEGLRFLARLSDLDGYLVDAKGVATFTSGFARYFAS